MTAATVYVLDANIFIEAKQRYYAFDLCPGFWNALIWQRGQGAVVSIDRVKAELEGNEDELSHMACTLMPGACFLKTDADHVMTAYAEVIGWVTAHDQFTPEAKAEPPVCSCRAVVVSRALTRCFRHSSKAWSTYHPF